MRRGRMNSRHSLFDSRCFCRHRCEWAVIVACACATVVLVGPSSGSEGNFMYPVADADACGPESSRGERILALGKRARRQDSPSRGCCALRVGPGGSGRPSDCGNQGNCQRVRAPGNPQRLAHVRQAAKRARSARQVPTTFLSLSVPTVLFLAV